MNWNDKNNPWGSGGGNNPWGGGPSGKDFEETINKARDKFSKFKLGKPRNIFLLIIIAFIIAFTQHY